MVPTLDPGDDVFVEPPRGGARPAPGDIVVARHPFKRSVLLIKRLEGLGPDGEHLVLRGDNPAASSDSRSLGSVPRELLVGIVRSRRKR